MNNNYIEYIITVFLNIETGFFSLKLENQSCLSFAVILYIDQKIIDVLDISKEDKQYLHETINNPYVHIYSNILYVVIRNILDRFGDILENELNSGKITVENHHVVVIGNIGMLYVKKENDRQKCILPYIRTIKINKIKKVLENGKL